MALTLRLIADNAAPLHGRREQPRSRVMLSAVMMTAAAEVNVIIRDISCSGAMISTPVSPPLDSYVTLRRGEVCVVGRVAWSKGKNVGLQFREEIDHGSLLVVIGRPGKVAAH